ncbi:hypothetical protein V9T40_007117 [Parthenolecanium corni]|uniref:Uncharacterized protein n=1 Tax=Parthenolecanium corni TaxID=536013 RepID=A0AAN9TTZ2_9HEMI
MIRERVRHLSENENYNLGQESKIFVSVWILTSPSTDQEDIHPYDCALSVRTSSSSRPVGFESPRSKLRLSVSRVNDNFRGVGERGGNDWRVRTYEWISPDKTLRQQKNLSGRIKPLAGCSRKLADNVGR